VPLSESQRKVLVGALPPAQGTRALCPRPATNKDIADEIHLSDDAVKGTPARAVRALRARRPAIRTQKRARLAAVALVNGVVQARTSY
jgi:hypothetical protein